MPKVTILPQQRLYEFPESGFQVYDNKLYCPFCNEFLDHMKKCVIKAHSVSRKHAKGKSDHYEHYQQQQAFGISPINSLIQAQMSMNINNSYEMSRASDYSTTRKREVEGEERQQQQQKKKKTSKSTKTTDGRLQRETVSQSMEVADSNRTISSSSSTLVDVKIPITVFDDQRFRFWLKDNLDYELPKKSFGSLFYDDGGVSAVDLGNTAAACFDRDVCIVLDDTMDTGTSGLIALNVFVSPLGEQFKLKLVATQFLETYDTNAAFRLTVSALESVRIEGKNVVVLLSSNSEYFVAVGDPLKQFCPRLHCFPCWETILGAVINEVRSQCTILDQLAFAVDTALKADPHRKQSLIVDLKQQSKDGQVRLLPYLVSSKRPFDWLRVVIFLCDNFDWLKSWMSTINETGLNPLKLKDLVCRDQTKELLKRIQNISCGLSKVIDDFEKGTLLPSCIWSTMFEVANGLSKEGFAISELKIRLESMMPSAGFWKIVELLDHRMVTCDSSQISTYVKELYFFGTDPVPIEEIQRYEKIVSGTKALSPTQFWKTCSNQLPTISRLALKVLSVPLSTSFVEKTFSMSKTWNFSSSKSDSVALDMRIFFNSK